MLPFLNESITPKINSINDMDTTIKNAIKLNVRTKSIDNNDNKSEMPIIIIPSTLYALMHFLNISNAPMIKRKIPIAIKGNPNKFHKKNRDRIMSKKAMITNMKPIFLKTDILQNFFRKITQETAKSMKSPIIKKII